MALAVTVNITIADARGRSSVTKVRVPTGFSVAQYLEFGQAMAQIIANISEGVITHVSIGVPLSLSGATIRATANALADVAEKFLFAATTAVTGLFARFHIPTADQTFQISGGDSVDVADASMAAYIAVLESGVSGVTPVDRRDNDITDIHLARLVDRAS